MRQQFNSLETKVAMIKTLIKTKTTNGQFFGITFTKKDGSLRVMNCRLGVKKYLKGGKNTTQAYEKFLTVFDTNADGYRNVNLETVLRLSLGGKDYSVEVM